MGLIDDCVHVRVVRVLILVELSNQSGIGTFWFSSMFSFLNSINRSRFIFSYRTYCTSTTPSEMLMYVIVVLLYFLVIMTDFSLIFSLLYGTCNTNFQ